MKAFTKIEPFGPNAYTYWISGIYKIVSYRKGEYQAYFIQEWFKNWGDHPSPPPDKGLIDDCWRTMASAKKACRDHAANYQPSAKIIKRAEEIKAATIQQSIDFHCPDCGDWFDQYGKCESCKVAA